MRFGTISSRIREVFGLAFSMYLVTGVCWAVPGSSQANETRPGVIRIGTNLNPQQSAPSEARVDVPVEESTVQGFGFNLKVQLKIIPGILSGFSRFPESVRSIPTHKDDGWFGTPGAPRVVPDGVITPGPFTTVGMAAAPQYAYRRLTVRGGLYLGALTLPVAQRGTGWSTQSINQAGGRERGVGTSLVFYSVVARKLPRIDPFAEFQIGLSRHISLVAGYATLKTGFKIRNGYDRYDSLETHKTYPISTNRIFDRYAGIRIGPPHDGLVLTFGQVIQRVDLLPLGNNMTTGFRERGYSIGIAYDGVLRRKQTGSDK